LKDTLYIFDIDGTLTDSVAMYLISVTNAMIKMGIKDIDTNYNAYKHHTDSYALRYNYERNFTKPYQVGLLDDFENHLMKEMTKFHPVNEIAGAKAFVHFLKQNSIPFVFATGALPKPAKLKLDQCDIWYDEVLLATSKTHETREGFVQDAIQRAKKYYDISEFKNIISLGDGLWDLKTAQNLGINFVGIGDKNKEKLLHFGARQCYHDIAAFRKSLV